MDDLLSDGVLKSDDFIVTVDNGFFECARSFFGRGTASATTFFFGLDNRDLTVYNIEKGSVDLFDLRKDAIKSWLSLNPGFTGSKYFEFQDGIFVPLDSVPKWAEFDCGGKPLR